MACEDEDDDLYEVDEAVAEGVSALQDVELFLDLDEKRIKRLMRLGDEGEINITAAELRSVIEAHLRERNDPMMLRSPQSVEAFTAVIDVDVSKVFFADPDPSFAHIDGRHYAKAVGDEAEIDNYPETVMLEPETHDEWVGCYNEALAAVGDDRRFVSFNVDDFEEPLYLLVTDEQAEALARARLLSYTNNEVKICNGLGARQRAEQLASGLTTKGIAARADVDHVVLDLDLAAAAAVLDKLRADLHHDERVHMLVNESVATNVRP